MSQTELLITVGRIVRPHGLRGLVRVIPTTDDPGRFDLLQSVGVVLKGGRQRRLTLERVVRQPQALLLKFTEINDREAAEELRGAKIVIHRSEALPLPPDTYYIFDLIGSQVRTTTDLDLGVLEEVWDLPANDVYVVRNGEREYLIPAVADFIKKVDIENKLIVVEPVDGLLSE